MRMKLAEIRRLLVFTGILFTLGVLLSASAAHRPPSAEAQASANEIVLALDPAGSKVHWTLGATVHNVRGTFALKRGTVRLDPENGKASGEIVADAASGESGNGSRDKKMRNEVLETSRYAEVIFRPDRFEGRVPALGSATVLIHGTFLLHGSEHTLTVPVQTELTAGHWKGTAKFPIPYVDWGLRNPSNFLLKVDPFVEIDLQMKGTVQGPTAP
jgi:polyisoprenoid-binding protein YceI